MSFREEPKSLEEMLEWGMISKFIYERVLHIKDFEEAKKYISRYYGYQTWSFQPCHIWEYVEENDIDIASFTMNDFAVFCIKLAKGRMNPTAPVQVYKSFLRQELR